MKFKGSDKFVLVNPSPNLMKIGANLRALGKDVKTVKLGEYNFPLVSTVYYITDFGYYGFDKSSVLQKEDIFSNSALIFQKGIINSIKYMKLKNKFKVINKKTALRDKMIFSRKRIKESYNINYDEVINSDINHCRSLFKDYLFISSYYNGIADVKGLCRYKFYSYKVDFNTSSCFDSSYFIFIKNNLRAEVCFNENKIYVIIDRLYNFDELMQKEMNFLNSYKLERVSEGEILRNENPWVRFDGTDIVYFNDYSFFMASTKMPDSWYDNAGRFLCTGKQL